MSVESIVTNQTVHYVAMALQLLSAPKLVFGGFCLTAAGITTQPSDSRDLCQLANWISSHMMNNG